MHSLNLNSERRYCKYSIQYINKSYINFFYSATSSAAAAAAKKQESSLAKCKFNFASLEAAAKVAMNTTGTA
jgi:hypothetical protein